MPTKTHSLHRIYDPRFAPAIAKFCIGKDRHHMAQYRQQAHEALPFNADNMPGFLEVDICILIGSIPSLILAVNYDQSLFCTIFPKCTAT